MELTFYGQNCLGLTIGDINILVDPFISGNAGSPTKFDQGSNHLVRGS